MILILKNCDTGFSTWKCIKNYNKRKTLNLVKEERELLKKINNIPVYNLKLILYGTFGLLNNEDIILNSCEIEI